MEIGCNRTKLFFELNWKKYICVIRSINRNDTYAILLKINLPIDLKYFFLFV